MDSTPDLLENIIGTAIRKYNSRIILRNFINKHYWKPNGWRERFEINRMHPKHSYLLKLVNDFT